ncbi:hypothetical protein D1872_230340 [compost metagenome]
MEHDSFVYLFQSVDRYAFGVSCRITSGCQHHAHRRFILPLNLHLIQRAIYSSEKNIEQIGFQTRQNHLSFRITETCIKLNGLRLAVRRNHQSGK